MGSGSSVDTKSGCKTSGRADRYVKGSRMQRPLHGSKAWRRKSKKLVTTPGLDTMGLTRVKEREDPIQRLTRRALMAEKERNEAIMGSMRSWIVGQQVGDVWKAKYIKERKKVARLWRSYCAIKYPTMVTATKRPPQLLWDAGFTIFACARVLRRWATNSSETRRR